MARTNPHRSSSAPAPAALDGRRIGVLAHQIVAELVAAGHRRPTPRQVMAAVAEHEITRNVAVYRQAAHQQLGTACSLYFRLFMPDEEWRFAGCEVSAPRTRFDLVWEDSEGRVLVDELKFGRLAASERRVFEDQLQRQLTAGSVVYADKFAGVRALLFSAPRQSFWAQPDGGHLPLQWENS